MRVVDTPMARAASTNSVERKESVCPRTTRAISIHENAVMVSTTRWKSRPKIVTSKIAISR